VRIYWYPVERNRKPWEEVLIDQLSQFIQDNPERRELKRALAVQMVQQDYRHRESQQILQVSSGFISKWTEAYE
jgi:putative transposase